MVAVDLPSGIDADTGAVDGPAVRADVTVTFGVIKPGLLVDPGAGYAGTVELIDIGLGPHLTGEPAAVAPQHEDIALLLPRPGSGIGQVPPGGRRRAGGQRPVRRGGRAGHRRGGARRRGDGPGGDRAGPGRRRSARPGPRRCSPTYPDDPGWDLIGSVGRVQAWVAGPGMGTGPDAGRG